MRVVKDRNKSARRNHFHLYAQLAYWSVGSWRVVFVGGVVVVTNPAVTANDKLPSYLDPIPSKAEPSNSLSSQSYLSRFFFPYSSKNRIC